MIDQIWQLHNILHETAIPIFACLRETHVGMAVNTGAGTLPFALAPLCWPFKNTITPNSKRQAWNVPSSKKPPHEPRCMVDHLLSHDVSRVCSLLV